ncbi:hypothetical protein GWI33_015064 [Rhynchophorus ferrugineus]|uniref:Uncharacterized protein n=1 Tax=Rhynchophorus ferrugineus TaxID=354439 RepID=A0A834I3A9_RHYFE|nr:hypothetical protein GWI33_015064 [Rhynchophorus ferrugineus]
MDSESAFPSGPEGEDGRRRGRLRRRGVGDEAVSGFGLWGECERNSHWFPPTQLASPSLTSSSFLDNYPKNLNGKMLHSFSGEYANGEREAEGMQIHSSPVECVSTKPVYVLNNLVRMGRRGQGRSSEGGFISVLLARTIVVPLSRRTFSC